MEEKRSNLWHGFIAGFACTLVGVLFLEAIRPRAGCACSEQQDEAVAKRKDGVSFLANLRSRRLNSQRRMWVNADWNERLGVWESTTAQPHLPFGNRVVTLDELRKDGGWRMGLEFIHVFDTDGTGLGEYYIEAAPGNTGQKPIGDKPPTTSGDRPPDA